MSSNGGGGGDKKGSPDQFDALFAAAEASIDRLKAQKHRDEVLDEELDGEDFGAEDRETSDAPAPVDDMGARSPRDAPPPPPADQPPRRPPAPSRAKELLPNTPSASAPKPRLPPGPLRSQGMPSKPPQPTSSKTGTADQALTSALIRARNELSTLVEKQKTQHAKEVTKLRDRIEQLKGTQSTSRDRAERERSSAVDREREKVLKTLLPVVDNLERALSTDIEALSGEAKEVLEGLTIGIENVIRLARSSLKQLGVEAFVSLGEPFDPQRHEAIRKQNRSDVADNTVVEEYHKGYHIDGRLLRPALVVVAQGGPPNQKG